MSDNNLEPIKLEAFVNEHGFLSLRDRESKRPLYLLQSVEVSKDGADDVQTAIVKIVVDPRT